MFKTNLGLLRIIGLLEGISFLVLMGIAMPLKYIWDMPELIYSTGMAHGLLFVLYIFFVLLIGYQLKWSFTKVFWALLASLLPFGTFIADKKLFQKEL
ncbi:MAG: integral membrane protein [Crocinitomix sp.]|jgi:integral membrane protein